LINHWDSVTGLKPGVNENVELRQLSDFWGKARSRFALIAGEGACVPSIDGLVPD